MKKNTKK